MDKKQWEKGMEGLEDDLILKGDLKNKGNNLKVFIPVAAVAAASVLTVGIWAANREFSINTGDSQSVVMYNTDQTVAGGKTEEEQNNSNNINFDEMIDEGNVSDEKTEKIYYLAYGSSYSGTSSSSRYSLVMSDIYFDAMTEFTDKTGTALYDGESNFIYSPAGLLLALDMLGQTENERGSADIYSFLGIDQDKAVGLAEVISNGMLVNYPMAENEMCDVSNSLWYKEGLFSAAAEEQFSALDEKFSADIIRAEELTEVEDEMNKWVSEATNGSGIQVPKVDKDEVIRLINAIYFNMSWNGSFRFSDSSESSFTNSDGSISAANMICTLYRTDSYIEADNYSMTRLNYSDGSYMLLFLPKEGVEPGELLDGEISSAIARVRKADTDHKRILLTMPEVKYSCEIKNIVDVLSSWLSSAFSFEAFEGMLVENSEYIVEVSAITQSSEVAINKDGTAAAAVTVVQATAAATAIEGVEEEIITMDINRPYAYAICAPNGTIIFEGIVNSAD